MNAHPGFKAVEKKIGERPGIRNPGAVLADATRKASPTVRKKNPRLNRVKGKPTYVQRSFGGQA